MAEGREAGRKEVGSGVTVGALGGQEEIKPKYRQGQGQPHSTSQPNSTALWGSPPLSPNSTLFHAGPLRQILPPEPLAPAVTPLQCGQLGAPPCAHLFSVGCPRYGPHGTLTPVGSQTDPPEPVTNRSRALRVAKWKAFRGSSPAGG